LVQVPSIRLDDLIGEKLSDGDRIFVLKIDTQGYEPAVFAGLEKSVFEKARIDYILFEYWPKGMDLMTTGDIDKRACVAAELLEALQEAGYTIFALPTTSHPRAPAEARRALRNEQPPVRSVKENCMYFYQLEDRFPDLYKMGYWSDILAVANNASLVQNPTTKVGQVIQQQQRQASLGEGERFSSS
jgi:Methyltransferase FkbM domain